MSPDGMGVQVRESELWAFHDHAVPYFAFVRNTPALLPSVLVKVRPFIQAATSARLQILLRVVATPIGARLAPPTPCPRSGCLHS